MNVFISLLFSVSRFIDHLIQLLFFISFQQVVDMMLRMRREMAGTEAQITPQIDNLLIIDRTVDPITPLLSQLTYEGLIDEVYGISNSKFI